MAKLFTLPSISFLIIAVLSSCNEKDDVLLSPQEEDNDQQTLLYYCPGDPQNGTLIGSTAVPDYGSGNPYQVTMIRKNID